MEKLLLKYKEIQEAQICSLHIEHVVHETELYVTVKLKSTISQLNPLCSIY